MTIIDHSITDHQGLVGETNLASGTGKDAAIASQVVSGIGVYDVGTTYDADDLTVYSGFIWKCLTNGTTAITPDNTTSNWVQISTYVNPRFAFVDGASGFTSKNGLLPFNSITSAIAHLGLSSPAGMIQLLSDTTDDVTISNMNLRISGCVPEYSRITGTMNIVNSEVVFDNIRLDGQFGLDTLTLGSGSFATFNNVIVTSTAALCVLINNPILIRYTFVNCIFSGGNINISAAPVSPRTVISFVNCRFGGTVFLNTIGLGVVFNSCQDAYYSRNEGFVVVNGTMIIDLASTIDVPSLTGDQTIDGVLTSNKQLIWLNAQTTPSETGLWETSSGGAWTQLIPFSELENYLGTYGLSNLFVTNGVALAHSYIDFKKDSLNVLTAFSDILAPL